MARKESSEVIDWRSTGRRRARRVLYRSRIDYVCADCGVTTLTRPKDAPTWFEEIWPVEEALNTGKWIESQLQADHETKDLTDNWEEDLCWRCPSCHKLHDNLTEKGTSTKSEDSYFL